MAALRWLVLLLLATMGPSVQDTGSVVARGAGLEVASRAVLCVSCAGWCGFETWCPRIMTSCDHLGLFKVSAVGSMDIDLLTD